MTSLDDAVRRRLQDHFSDGLVTVVGSGYPAGLGMPGMRQLADALVDEMPCHVGADAAEWERVATALVNGTGLEAALDALPSDSSLIPQIVAVTARLIGGAEAVLLAEVLGGARRLALADLLRHIAFAGHPQIITTNYDRIVELAVELAGYALDCSFVGSHACRFEPRASLASLRSEVVTKGSKAWMRYRRHVRLWKPHGSLDWYVRDGEPFRTPYSVGLPRLMITPGASKYVRGYERPFDAHREEANRAIDAAARFLTIGYGFNDPHLQTHLAPRISNGVPTLILAQTLSDPARELVAGNQSVVALEQRAESGTLIHIGNDQHEVSHGDLWSLDGFIDEVLE